MTSPDIKKIRMHSFEETSFKFLMQKRICKVLIICSNYDIFLIEEDGRVDEQIFNEYASLNIRYPPLFIHANSAEKAMRILHDDQIDLVVSTLSFTNVDMFTFFNSIKIRFPKIPIVVLTNFSREIRLKLEKADLSAVDYVFSWLGKAEILLAVIKLIEDKMNMVNDIENIGVQAILLVEDSVRFYSSYLPNIYRIILEQSKDFMTEGLNEHQSMLRLRGRPKIIMCKSYQEALEIYNKYKDNLLGIISDINFPAVINGPKDALAGLKLARIVKEDDPFFPFLLQSSDGGHEKTAKEIGVGFINKNSKTLSIELRDFVMRYFAFGDFIFVNPDSKDEIARAHDLKTLQHQLEKIPGDSLFYHTHRNHISKWLKARALFPLADMIKALTPEDFKDIESLRNYLVHAIAEFRLNKGRGVIAKFDRNRYDEYFTFTRLGDGSVGGKARGLAFIDTFLHKYKLFNQFPNISIKIPRTLVLCTDIFDEFMERNKLYTIALSDAPDEEILKEFVGGRFPHEVFKDLEVFANVTKNPIAIRSSSLLEDSHYQPFAGIYSTYMIPKVDSDPKLMMQMLTEAIKCVYASVFFKSSKAYMTVTQNVIDEEKMAIVLQEVCGNRYRDKFYPTVSGVARSINFYPIEPETPQDGIANIALGLGKIIVDGGKTLRFSPAWPKKILQLSSTDMTLRETQKYFYALDLDAKSFKPDIDEGVNIKKIDIRDAEGDNAINYVASTYDYQNNVIRDGTRYAGKKIITFSNILQHATFPLPEILKTLLQIGQREMNSPIEIEFAVNLDTPPDQPKIFSFLQIRPIVENTEVVDMNFEQIKIQDTILSSNQALGNGIIKDIVDFVYVKPEAFNAADSKTIAADVEKINEAFVREKKFYILVGPGRWGSSDPWLGIPVNWAQICNARVIVESGLENYRIDPSQGTHFFQNLTSFRVGYFTINPFNKDGYYDVDFLNQQPTIYEDKYLRHIRFACPLEVVIDGSRNKGVIFKPEHLKDIEPEILKSESS